MNNDWHNIHITDKSGKKFFETVASPMSTMSEVKNLTQHLNQAVKYPLQYKFLDVASAVVVLDGEVYGQALTTSDEDLLKELGL